MQLLPEHILDSGTQRAASATAAAAAASEEVMEWRRRNEYQLQGWKLTTYGRAHELDERELELELLEKWKHFK